MADDGVQIPFLHILASVLAWASAVVNPFIYAFKNRQYQQAFIKVIVCKVTRSNSLSLILLGCVTRIKIHRKIASSNTSCLEAHVGFFRLLMKGTFDPYIL